MCKYVTLPVAFCLAGSLLVSAVAHAQGPPRGFWAVPDGDIAHNNWQRGETEITTETVGKDFKFLWKLKLGNGMPKSASFSEPLLYPGMITGKGFKDFAFVADARTVYAVDSELGSLVWQKDFAASGASKACGNIQILTEAPQVIHFGARKPAVRKPATPPPAASNDPIPASSRRVGGPAGGGYFGLRGVYVLTSDGYLHEQIMATGLDYAKPVKFFPAPAGSSFGLNMNDHVLYAAAGSGCKNEPNTLWSIDLNSAESPVSSYAAAKTGVAGYTGAAVGADGTAYVATGSGADDPSTGLYGNSVVALAPATLKVKDWYQPSAAGKTLNASPVVVTDKEKELIAAPGKDGSIVLLDSASLGGTDHHTPLAQSIGLVKGSARGGWESLATWTDKAGALWVLASIAGPINPEAKFANSNGPAPHGSIVAFKVEEKDGHTVLTPSWVSRDLKNPAPPAVANGVVFALDSGSASQHATLYALDAATGKQLYSSGNAIGTYTRLAGMSVGDGHVFFTTHDGTLYSFGIPLEH